MNATENKPIGGTATPEMRASYSIERRLSKHIAILIAGALAIMSFAIYCAAAMLIERKQVAELEKKVATIQTIVKEAAAEGGYAQLARTADLMAQRRPGTRLEVMRANGELVYRDPDQGPWKLSDKTKSQSFAIDLSVYSIGVLNGIFTIDVEDDAGVMDDLFWALVTLPILGGVLVGLLTAWRVRREMRPLQVLANQTKRISPQHLEKRLSIPVVAEELAPWVNQFNALMERLQTAMEQLEAFNADVAHELRTPLAALIGNTEVTLSKNRPAHEMRDTMITSLEQMRDLSTMVNDMLFLSGADRGALARRGEPTRICSIAKNVVEFHEFALEEAGLTAEVHGTAVASVDAPLLQRALSNLIGNATRFAEPGSSVRVLIEELTDREIQVVVENRGPAIEPSAMPRLFDRFFRIDSARKDCETHHGLGLAIVSAIARMHGGRPLVSSADGITRVGLTLQTN
jgi:two-component system, OmpR family, heavy metal sensor histidine kinase CusS